MHKFAILEIKSWFKNMQKVIFSLHIKLKENFLKWYMTAIQKLGVDTIKNELIQSHFSIFMEFYLFRSLKWREYSLLYNTYKS
jgi:hypothetical protein